MELPGQTKTNQKKPRRRQSIFQLLQYNSVSCPKTSFANWIWTSLILFLIHFAWHSEEWAVIPPFSKTENHDWLLPRILQFHADFSHRFLSFFPQASRAAFLNQLPSLRNIDLLEHSEDDWGIRNVVEQFLEFLSRHDLLMDTWKYNLTTDSWA